jgi:hypothetical protein
MTTSITDSTSGIWMGSPDGKDICGNSVCFDLNVQLELRN